MEIVHSVLVFVGIVRIISLLPSTIRRERPSSAVFSRRHFVRRFSGFSSFLVGRPPLTPAVPGARSASTPYDYYRLGKTDRTGSSLFAFLATPRPHAVARTRRTKNRCNIRASLGVCGTTSGFRGLPPGAREFGRKQRIFREKTRTFISGSTSPASGHGRPAEFHWTRVGMPGRCLC